MIKKLDFSHIMHCTPPSKIELPKIKRIKEVREFMDVLSKKGYAIYPEKTHVDCFKNFENYSGPITSITDDDVRPRKVVIKGHNLDIMLYNYCTLTPPSKPYSAGIKGYIKVDGENKNKFSELVWLIKNHWKPKLFPELDD